jgi:hypothetical protein
MKPVPKITAEEENFRIEEKYSTPRFTVQVPRRDSVEPVPVGTLILTAFRVTGYDPDCDGSLMARLEHVDKHGRATGWRTKHVGLYPDVDLVLDGEDELLALFQDARDNR